MSEVYIFTGHFGSGKTEVAVNYAFYLKKKLENEKVAIVDLDIVNPFFRTADSAEALRNAGIRVQLPLYANTNVDVPALTPEIGYLVSEPSYNLILDLGGDDLGSRALGRYNNELIARGYNMFFVINTYRPYTDNIENACKMFDDIQKSSGLKITGIINNTNLLEKTTHEIVSQGMAVIKALSEIKHVPIVLWTAMEDVASDLLGKTDGVDILPLKEYVSLLWPR